MAEQKVKRKLKFKPVPGSSSGAAAEKREALQQVIATCNKSMGVTGAIYFGDKHPPTERAPTGIVAIDFILGGGLPRAQMVQFTGADSCFKTTAAVITAKTFQERGEQVVWVTGEGFDKAWAASWGVNLKNLVLISTMFGDTALEAAMTMIDSGAVDLMVLDSVQSLGTTRELDEGGVDDESYAGAGAPQMWGRVMRRTYSSMNKGARTSIISISQARSAIGKRAMHGRAPEPEGTQIYALKHWKAADIIFTKGEMDYDGEATEKRLITSREFKVVCKKNKTARPERVSRFVMEYTPDGPKIDNVSTAVRCAAALGLIEVKGSWYRGYGIRSQGEAQFIAAITGKPKVYNEIYNDVLYEAGKP